MAPRRFAFSLTAVLVACFLLAASGCASAPSQAAGPASAAASASASSAAASASAASSDSPSAQSGGVEAAAPGIKSATPRNVVELPKSLDYLPEAYLSPCATPGTLEYFTYSTNTYDDEARPMEKQALVYLPYGYGDPDAPESYDIMYYMHGAGGDIEGFLGAPGEYDTTRCVVDNLIANGDMEPTIIVCATFYLDNESVDLDDWGAFRTKNFGRELHDDLVPQIEAKYRTYASGTFHDELAAARGHRIFGGFSMGGVTTWYRLCDCLDYFEYFLPLSGNLMWGYESYVERAGGAGFTTDMAADAVLRQGYGKDDFFLFASAGEEDFALGIVEAQAAALPQRPDVFVTGGDAGEANTLTLIGDGEEHGSENINRFFYNALPLVSAMTA